MKVVVNHKNANARGRIVFNLEMPGEVKDSANPKGLDQNATTHRGH